MRYFLSKFDLEILRWGSVGIANYFCGPQIKLHLLSYDNVSVTGLIQVTNIFNNFY